MEKDCEMGNGRLSIASGISVEIQKMEKCDLDVLGWDKESNLIVKAKQTHFQYRGERECVELVFSDGRKKGCTLEHQMLTSDNQWVKACDIELGKTEVKVGVTYPLVDIDEDVSECNNWSLTVGSSFTLKTNTRKEFMKSMCFARILGYLLTDGCISGKNKIQSSIFLGHQIDVDRIVDDFTLLGIPVNPRKAKNLFEIRIPTQLTRDILTLDGILCGRRVAQPGTWPAFILDENCPRPIVREFLGGVFGGDGHTCSLLKRRGKYDNVTSVGFSQSKYEEHVDSLKSMMEQLQRLLKKCGIDGTTVQEPKQTTYSKNRHEISEDDSNDETKENTRPPKCYELTLRINTDELIKFHDNIGFRYCCHKSHRLSAAVSYIRLREETIRQRLCMVKRAIELTNTMTVNKALDQSIKELEQREVIVHPYAIPTISNVRDSIRSSVKSDTVKLTAKSKTGESDRVFPTAEQFFTDMGVLNWFTEEESAVCYGVNREHCALPTMKLRVVGRRPVGKQRVYDITVDGINNFVANGIVSHNCILSHGAAEFLKETLQDRSDNYRMHTCKSCGLISSVNKEAGIYMCKNCNNTTKFAEVRIPYAMKLFIQELETMSVAPRIVTKED